MRKGLLLAEKGIRDVLHLPVNDSFWSAVGRRVCLGDELGVRAQGVPLFEESKVESKHGKA